MNESIRKHDASRPLMPHQQALIDQFFAEPAIRGYIVRWAVGLGKSYTVVHLIKRLLATQPAARILVLSPGALQSQMRDMLEQIGVSAEAVDRFRYRELQDAVSPHSELWWAGRVYLLSTDFAKQEDIALSLCSVQWTLLVVDEAQQLRAQRKGIVRALVASSPKLRALLLSSTGIDDPSQLGIEPWKETRTRAVDVVDAAGRRILDQPRPELKILEFHLDDSERRLRDSVDEIAQVLGVNDSNAGLPGPVFAALAASSPSALEAGLRRLRNRLAHGAYEFSQTAGEQGDMGDLSDAGEHTAVLPGDPGELLELLNRCLNELDALAVDSKLVALKTLLGQAQVPVPTPRPMCIVTSYRATLLYLQAALEELGITPWALYGAMSDDTRVQTVRGFAEHGGVLLATTAALKGLSMQQVDLLVMYDLPRNPSMVVPLLTRFQRVGRTDPLTLTVLLESKAERTVESALISKLQAFLADDQDSGVS